MKGPIFYWVSEHASLDLEDFPNIKKKKKPFGCAFLLLITTQLMEKGTDNSMRTVENPLRALPGVEDICIATEQKKISLDLKHLFKKSSQLVQDGWVTFPEGEGKYLREAMKLNSIIGPFSWALFLLFLLS